MNIFKKIDFKSLLFNVFMPCALSLIVSMLIGNFSDYYSALNKFINVPAKAFPIIWIILYILMGIASYIIYEIGTSESKNAYYLYWISLITNVLWPLFFFEFHMLLFSAIWLGFLLLLIILVIKRFYKLNLLSFWLMIPYLLWTIFALILNISCVILN